jgi:hypothetical protein
MDKQIKVFTPFYCSASITGEMRTKLLVDLEGFLQRVNTCVTKGDFSSLLLVDDGNDVNVQNFLLRMKERYSWLQIYRNEKNIGLDKTLFGMYGYFVDKSLSEDDIIVRLDSDGEHDPLRIKEMIGCIEQGVEGALCQIEYKEEHLQPFDVMFNSFQGAVQGEVILGFGQKLLHNSPGFCAYRVSVLRKVLPLIEGYLKLYREKFDEECKWGADMIVLFYAVQDGFNVDVTVRQKSLVLPANRTMQKMLEQLRTNTQHLQLMMELKQNAVNKNKNNKGNKNKMNIIS